MGGQMETPARRAATPGQGGRSAIAAGTLGIAKSEARRKDSGTVYEVIPTGGEPFPVTVKGRPKWALKALIEAGARGITSMENPAPRMSGYIHLLRGMGVPIETQHEPHGGEFAGHHARYRLQAQVRFVGLVADHPPITPKPRAGRALQAQEGLPLTSGSANDLAPAAAFFEGAVQ
jgi:hypothetical protein